jgi:DNA-binding XRE family transcriptional regulator
MIMNNSKFISDNYLYFNKYHTVEFAKKLKVPWYKARMIETGEYMPNSELKDIICKLLNCTEDDLYRPHIRRINRTKHQIQSTMYNKFAI